MDASLRQLVRVRARDQCEYCRLPQSAATYFRFHVEHIQARQHGAGDDFDNLALACPDCNRHKGPNLTTLDVETNEIVRLFHPRQDAWIEHFAFDGPIIVGKTLVGKATARLLQLNAGERVEMRAQLLDAGLLDTIFEHDR